MLIEREVGDALPGFRIPEDFGRFHQDVFLVLKVVVTYELAGSEFGLIGRPVEQGIVDDAFVVVVEVYLVGDGTD